MGIPLGSNFTVNTGLPLDDRTVVTDLTARDAINTGRRYEGLTVFVRTELKSYQLQGGIGNVNWIEVGGAGAGAALINVDTFIGDGIVTTFTLSADPVAIENISVFVDGVYQKKNDSFTLSGLDIIFSEAPPANALDPNNIEVVYTTPATPLVIPNGSITEIKLANDAVTQAKLAAKTTNTTSAALGQVLITASNGTQSGITTATDITNATGTIVSKGRPVIVSLSPIDTGANTAIESVSTSNPADIRGEVWLYRNGSVVMKTSYGGYVAATGVTAFRGYVSLPVVFTDVNAPAGSNTYKITIVPSSGTVSVSNVRMIAYEI